MAPAEGESQPELLLCDTSFVSLIQRAGRSSAAQHQTAEWPSDVRSRLEAAVLLVSVVTVAELRAGQRYAGWSEKRRASADATMAAYGTVPLDASILEGWSVLWAELRRNGQVLSHNDIWIAATALSRDLPLVSLDADFEQVPGLSHIYLA